MEDVLTFVGARHDRAAAEFKVVREWLGLTTRLLAEHRQVAERTLHRWEMRVAPVPDGVRIAAEELEARRQDCATRR